MIEKINFKDPLLFNINTNNYVVFAEQNVRILNTELFGTIFFGFASYINSGLIRSHCEIGRYCSIGRNVSIGLGNHDIKGLSTSPFFEFLISEDSLKLASDNPKRRVIIGNDVWIGDNAMIASGIKIGSGSVIAGGAVVTKDVEPYSIVGGVPAKLIKMRFKKNIIEKLNNLAWWDLDSVILKSLPFGDIESTIKILEEVSCKDNKFTQNYIRINSKDIK